MAANDHASPNHLGAYPAGTRVLNVQDAEPGVILNGLGFDPAAGWLEYEVQTKYGIERWLRGDFVLMSEIEQDA